MWIRKIVAVVLIVAFVAIFASSLMGQATTQPIVTAVRAATTTNPVFVDVPLTPLLTAAATAALPPPSPPPADPLYVHKGQSMTAAIAAMANGKTMYLERGGVWTGQLEWKWSNAKLLPFGDGLPPIMGGLLFKTPQSQCVFWGFNISPIPTAYGIDCRCGSCSDLYFGEILVSGGNNCASFRAPGVDDAKPETYHRDIYLYKVRFCDAMPLNPADQGDFSGQGLFAGNVNGLTLQDCVGIGNGYPKTPTAYRHFSYIKSTCNGVRFDGCIAGYNAAYGIQARPRGSQVTNCIMWGNGNAMLINGESGVAKNNIIVLGHAYAAPLTYGRGGMDASIGTGIIENNVAYGSPTPLPVCYQPPVFNIGPRTDVVWGYRGIVAPFQSLNVNKTATVVDLSEFEAPLRAQVCDIDAVKLKILAKVKAAN